MSIQETMEWIQSENDYEEEKLPETDLIGERVSIYLEYDGSFWTVYLGVTHSDIAYYCWVESEKLKYDNTYWGDYAAPEEALQALEKQTKEMKKKKAILVSEEQLYGDGYAKED